MKFKFTKFLVFICVQAWAEVALGSSMREVNIDWEVLDGASSYAIQIKLKNSDEAVVDSGLNEARWSGRLSYGDFVFRIRGKDKRGVGGPWSGWQKIKVRPKKISGQEIKEIEKSTRKKQKKVILSWAPIPNISEYKISIAGSGGFSKTLTAQTSELVLSLPVAQAYVWQVRAVANQIDGEKSDDHKFTLLGSRLKSPKIVNKDDSTLYLFSEKSGTSIEIEVQIFPEQVQGVAKSLHKETIQNNSTFEFPDHLEKGRYRVSAVAIQKMYESSTPTQVTLGYQPREKQFNRASFGAYYSPKRQTSQISGPGLSANISEVSSNDFGVRFEQSFEFSRLLIATYGLGYRYYFYSLFTDGSGKNQAVENQEVLQIEGDEIKADLGLGLIFRRFLFSLFTQYKLKQFESFTPSFDRGLSLNVSDSDLVGLGLGFGWTLSPSFSLNAAYWTDSLASSSGEIIGYTEERMELSLQIQFLERDMMLDCSILNANGEQVFQKNGEVFAKSFIYLQPKLGISYVW